MDVDITRRDFLNGVGVAIGASFLSPSLGAAEIAAQDVPGYYPPQRTGMRGSHDGSYETAHLAVNGRRWEGKSTGEEYDLAVVGAGISGLSAAYFFQQAAGTNARILILDNHDDFGGHAKRNEFRVDNRLMIGYGGTQSIEAPSGYPKIASDLIRDIGVDTKRFYTAFDRDLYRSLGLTRGTFFDKATFGRDSLIVGDLTAPRNLKRLPLSDKGKADLVRLFADDRHYLDDMAADRRLERLQRMSYRAYLKEHAGISDDVLNIAQSWSRSVWAIGIDALPATAAWSGGYPGFGDLDLGYAPYRREEGEPYIFHFPDGNASIARLLVRRMIPSVATGVDMEDIVTDRFDYGSLDDPESAVRLRLNSTVVRVQHVDGKLNDSVQVTYLRDGEANTVVARRVVLACYHGMIPYLCPEMPQQQRAALSNALRAPLVYTNVLIRNWSSLARLGVERVYCPACYHHRVMLDFPVSLGTYKFPKSPQEPMVLHLTRVPIEPGLSARDQFYAGRRDLLSTTFETFERNIRDQLVRMLGDGGFDPARDIAGITVNRWPHGYAYGYDPDTDEVAFEPDLWPLERQHWLRGSRPFGSISIAGTDAASNAMTESAIEEAHRAITDLS